MKIFRTLKAYNKEEAEQAIFGLGAIEAMDYDSGKRGHLILFSINLKVVKFIKKLFVTI